MSLALYRKYRPSVFADVIGQEHVTVPLSNALESGRTHHAYLFSGPRGCGKTSSARIIYFCTRIFIACNFWGITHVLAEDEGFEPSIGCPIHAFQACARGRYANPPEGSTLSVAITMITPDPSYGVIRTELPQGRNAARVGPLWRVCEGSY